MWVRCTRAEHSMSAIRSPAPSASHVDRSRTAVDPEASRGRRAVLVVRQARELEDVGMTSGNSHDTSSMAADQQRHMLLNGAHPKVVDRDSVMVALELCGTRVEQRTHDDDRLLESGDAFGRVLAAACRWHRARTACTPFPGQAPGAHPSDNRRWPPFERSSLDDGTRCSAPVGRPVARW